MARKAATTPLLVLVVVAAALVACGDDDDDASGEDAATQVDANADVAATCDSIEDLGNAVLEIQDATTVEEIQSAIQPRLDAFVAAAAASGDDQLSELAATTDAAFSTYLTAGGIDSREAGDEANVALDRAAARCIELGATNDFPEQP